MYFNSNEPNQTSQDNILANKEDLANNYEQMMNTGTNSNTKDIYDNKISDTNQGYVDYL